MSIRIPGREQVSAGTRRAGAKRRDIGRPELVRAIGGGAHIAPDSWREPGGTSVARYPEEATAVDQAVTITPRSAETEAEARGGRSLVRAAVAIAVIAIAMATSGCVATAGVEGELVYGYPTVAVDVVPV